MSGAAVGPYRVSLSEDDSTTDFKHRLKNSYRRNDFMLAIPDRRLIRLEYAVQNLEQRMQQAEIMNDESFVYLIKNQQVPIPHDEIQNGAGEEADGLIVPQVDEAVKDIDEVVEDILEAVKAEPVYAQPFFRANEEINHRLVLKKTLAWITLFFMVSCILGALLYSGIHSKGRQVCVHPDACQVMQVLTKEVTIFTETVDAVALIEVYIAGAGLNSKYLLFSMLAVLLVCAVVLIYIGVWLSERKYVPKLVEAQARFERANENATQAHSAMTEAEAGRNQAEARAQQIAEAAASDIAQAHSAMTEAEAGRNEARKERDEARTDLDKAQAQVAIANARLAEILAAPDVAAAIAEEPDAVVLQAHNLDAFNNSGHQQIAHQFESESDAFNAYENIGTESDSQTQQKLRVVGRILFIIAGIIFIVVAVAVAAAAALAPQ